MARTMYCRACGHVGPTRRVMPGSIAIELIFYFFLILPGLLYSAWRHGASYSGCRSCGSRDVIPPQSPIAIRELGQDVAAPLIAATETWDKVEITGKAIVLVVFVLGLIAIATINSNNNSANASARAKKKGATLNDADLIIANCGTPSTDASTAYDKPRPPIPTRLLTYRKQRVTVAFFPGANATVNSPPPYHWKLMGFVDSTSKTKLTSQQAYRRLNCAKG